MNLEIKLGITYLSEFILYERSLNDIRESNAGDKLHFDLGFNGVDWWRWCQCSSIPLEAIKKSFE